ncbi:metal ABC transporter solute-binding protein, Zn/Mn family [Leadbettera azotonutricia]|uniref:Putative cation ABC transporter, periplasmic binding protein n=1 Tax=Leadbettera azotonutricia (strain ATCC BAA-888 / DSM 13862 / ZAS-9) TaxID=545695 RepID=F5YC49_LEAAZ|nr:zinc ABC transporter substrate-binding protein [Leadbettera azotonutricia]AEF80863.1 putative cation ABC transporter, periplasmic binding protein [Leadbettera azotonutricia ZAS-9]
MKRFYLVVFLFAVSFLLFAGGKNDSSVGASAGGKAVLASTSWVAAIAKAGGAESVRILAPLDLRHPPEYELKPSDLAAASKADIIIYAGWEQFAKKLAETAGSAGVRIVTVNTSNTPEDLRAEAEKIARILGTEERFAEWWKNFEPFAEDLREKIIAAYPDRRAVVQRMQTPFAAWLGFEIIGEYGPAEPSPAVILQMVQLRPGLVIDNYHGPSGQPIAEAARASYAELLNFPGKDGTLSIEDVFRYNADVLIKAK